ncbi:Alcohol dehydrogenase 4 [Hondaea fermentalgiana]|uniref:Alcohol dehydrogenase 4 n=1 Tax=Hondaea fermentalgiana TaxID=2315210 RepID=A0A2R5GQ77_9STRA|nr:Alcohol dehydrogenase 4 [Hondaea fermentalgiana]|eukprot:GBG33032.1 Alcohol dehydrogenase 4 [Hondaea fermentalgiana]
MLGSLAGRAASVALPRRMLVGGGTVSRLGELVKEAKVTKPLIVTDGFMESSGVLAKVTKALEDADIAHGTFTDTIPEPTSEAVERCRAYVEQGDYDAIVALGGGSPMDTAKAAGALAVHKGQMRDYKAPFLLDAPALPLFAIPTTAGTGSEATKFTIVTDSDTHEKMLCIGLAYLPEYAVIDYELTMSMPWELTAATGIDAMCHAMEAYVSAKRNPFSSSMALAALSKIGQNVREVCYNPDNREAREAMMLASTEAGIAFSNASVTLIHGMSRPIGADFHVPHGLSNAMLAPKVTEFSIEGAVAEYAEVARVMAMAPFGASDEDAADALIKGLYALNTDLKVKTMSEWGIKEQDFTSAVQRMAKAALASGSPGNNPKVPSQEEIEKLYMDIYSS